MRILIFVLLALFAAPALAQDWGHYDNSRYNYGIDIPPGYQGQGESGNGDGQLFQRVRGARRLAVWGGLLGVANADFESEVKWRMDQAADDGWNLTYQATTPQWASFSALKGPRVLYQRMVLLCDRQSYAAFAAQYSARDMADMNLVIENLVHSLRGDCD